MHKIYVTLATVMFICLGCNWNMKPADEASEGLVQVERYDRLQSLYLTTGDFSAL
jgi:hypothetical protein